MVEYLPVYPFSALDARNAAELPDWRESHKENCACARAIEQSIAEHHQENILQDGTAELIERFGFDRLNWVLANTIQEGSHDGRYSRENKAWAKAAYIPNENSRRDFVVRSHPVLVNGFTDQLRRSWQALDLHDKSHCSEDTNFEGKVLLLKPQSLKEVFRTADNQLFFAKTGFGCNPKHPGKKVIGEFLKDGEHCSFRREDFLGVVKEEYLPEWAQNRLAELQDMQPSEPLTMGGM